MWPLTVIQGCEGRVQVVSVCISHTFTRTLREKHCHYLPRLTDRETEAPRDETLQVTLTVNDICISAAEKGTQGRLLGNQLVWSSPQRADAIHSCRKTRGPQTIRKSPCKIKQHTRRNAVTDLDPSLREGQ